jgi:hypothetical protein
MEGTTGWLAAGAMVLGVGGCTVDGGIQSQGYLRVVVTEICDASMTTCNPLPTAADPLPPNLGSLEEVWRITADAMDDAGNVDTGFNGAARVSVNPGAVSLVVQGGVQQGRNLRFAAGHAEGEVVLSEMFGATRLWVEDIGYVPAEAGQVPTCSNGVDDDGDVVNDFPNDPGCAFADDMTEEPGTLLTGVSQAVEYELPTLAHVQGYGSTTPFKAVAVRIKATAPSQVVVTRVSSNGFFVSDLSEPEYGHMYAYNFNAPAGMRVCDRLTMLGGTASEFFGFTEITFPSYDVGLWNPGGAACALDSDCTSGDYCRIGGCQPCPIPEPAELSNGVLASDEEMEKLESGLVRIEQVTLPKKFGPGLGEPIPEDQWPPDARDIDKWTFGEDASRCDLNGDGIVDYEDPLETSCSNACSADPECSDWHGFAGRGNYKVHRPGTQIMLQINTGTAGGFEPLLHKGKTLAYVTGTLHNFSGGRLNWTIETRCAEDLVCDFDSACVAAIVPSNQACFSPPTEDDNDAATY